MNVAMMKIFLSLVFFTYQVFLANKSYIGRMDRGKVRILSRAVKQCHFCENLFAKNEEAM